MDKAFESVYHQVEERHWWFQARRDMIFRTLRRYRAGKESKILDIGCSGGALLGFLKQKGFNNLYGIDTSGDAINLCKDKDLKNSFVMDGAKPEFEKGVFDIIIASDILEHIKDDRAALAEWSRILKSGGMLILFVPAFKFMWSSHDEMNHHYRRYAKRGLTSLLHASGFRMEKVSYWNCLLFLPIWFSVVCHNLFLKGKNQASRLSETNPVVNNLLGCILGFENLILERISFPVGVSLFVIARKN
jgi:SAM-dependent methyltransferase